MEGAILAERTRQHREMRLKGNAELKDKVEELRAKLQTERERMQKDFEGQVSMQTYRRTDMHRQHTNSRHDLSQDLPLVQSCSVDGTRSWAELTE